MDKLAVDVVFSLITAIPLRDYGDKADPEFSKVAIYLHLRYRHHSDYLF